ncbi:MAG: BON domain-containing protein [Stenotrophobium sp.]
MNTPSFRKTFLVLGLSVGLGASAAAFAEPPDSSMPQAHSDSMGAALSDTAITTRVKSRLMVNDSLKKSDISVTTTNGVVTLTGSASSEHAKSVAESEAKGADGVKSVDDELETPASTTTSAKAQQVMKKTRRIVSDSWITTKVKSEIAADSLSKGVDVSVETMHGVVVLKGALANQDAIDHVKDIAEKVQGVKSVDSSALTVASR